MPNFAQELQPSQQETTNAQQAAMWGTIAQAAAAFGSTALGFLPKNRDAQVAIAQANAEAERARAEAAAMQPKDNTTTYVIVGVVLVIIVVLMLRK